MEEKEKRKEEGENHSFGRGRRRISQVWLSLTLSYLFFRITWGSLLILRWLLWLPKEENLFRTFVYLIFVFSRMSCMLDIFYVWVLSSLRSSHQTLLVFVMQNLVLVVLYPLIYCSVLLPSFFVCSFPFSWLFPSTLGIFWRGDSLACRNQVSSTTPIFLSFTLHPTPSFT